MRALVALSTLLLLGSAHAASTVDRVLAVVGTTPITSSSVAFEAELRSALPVDPAACTEDFGRLLCSTEPTLQALIFREVLRQQGVAAEVEVSPSHAEARAVAVAQRFPDRESYLAFLGRWALSEGDLAERLIESVRLDRAVDVAVGRLVRDSTEDEERAYHAEHRDTEFDGEPFEAVASRVSRRVYSIKFERTYAIGLLISCATPAVS